MRLQADFENRGSLARRRAEVPFVETGHIPPVGLALVGRGGVRTRMVPLRASMRLAVRCFRGRVSELRRQEHAKLQADLGRRRAAAEARAASDPLRANGEI